MVYKRKKKKMKAFDWVLTILVLIGALNWGLVGVLDFNLVTFLFGGMPMLVSGIYIAVGVAAVIGLWRLIKK